MIFSTLEFWIFFLGVFFAYHLLAHRGQNVLLLIASYVFYGAWDWRFLGLIFFSTVVDYFAALYAAPKEGRRPRKRHMALGLSVFVNLGVLAVFKYFDFFLLSFVDLIGADPSDVDHLLLKVVLPVGISFYTFQTMSYTLDVYRGKLEATKSFADLALYVAFFPQLVAGPIERGAHLMPQVINKRTLDVTRFRSAVCLIIWGLFKKICIADVLAYPVQVIFASQDPTGGEVYFSTVCFAIQIFCDFSGYTDIARGLGRLLGFEFMLNFNLPYFAKSPTDFWRRWHISLSSWLRDYLYISLGGNRKGAKRTYFNLMATMVLGGLWHGAGVNFILWGIYHGSLLAIHRFLTRNNSPGPGSDSFLMRGLKIFGMFQLTLFGWLLFRVENMEQLSKLLFALGTHWDHWGSVWILVQYALPVMVVLLAMQLWQARSNDLEILAHTSWILRAVILSLCLSCVLLLNRGGGTPFIYFQF